MRSFICIVLCLGVAVCLTITNRTLKIAAAEDKQLTTVAAAAPALNPSHGIGKVMTSLKSKLLAE